MHRPQHREHRFISFWKCVPVFEPAGTHKVSLPLLLLLHLSHHLGDPLQLGVHQLLLELLVLEHLVYVLQGSGVVGGGHKPCV